MGSEMCIRDRIKNSLACPQMKSEDQFSAMQRQLRMCVRFLCSGVRGNRIKRYFYQTSLVVRRSILRGEVPRGLLDIGRSAPRSKLPLGIIVVFIQLPAACNLFFTPWYPQCIGVTFPTASVAGICAAQLVLQIMSLTDFRSRS